MCKIEPAKMCIIVSKVAKLDLKISQTLLKVPELELILKFSRS